VRRSKKLYVNYVCPKCFQQLNKCTCDIFPPYELIMIDEKIQYHIRELNKKGYATWVCCESHGVGEDIYIGLNTTKEMLETKLPSGFRFDKGQYIRCSVPRDCENPEEFKDQKLAELKDWIDQLPKNKSLVR